jgi:uncharacterized integral membrane protein
MFAPPSRRPAQFVRVRALARRLGYFFKNGIILLFVLLVVVVQTTTKTRIRFQSHRNAIDFPVAPVARGFDFMTFF